MTVLYILLGLAAALLLAALVRTLLLPKVKAEYTPAPDPVREALCAEKLSRMVQCETVSVRGAPDPEKFRGFHRVLAELYPNVFRVCEKTELDGNLLLRWPGKSREKPILLLAHMDVVAAAGDWTYPPFSGTIADGKVWGRGAGDTKASLMALLQAAEELITAGCIPACDVYLASSCTEEIGGDGAPKLAAFLQERGVHLSLLCDEGGAMTDAPIKGVPGTYAMVGVAEKGYGDLRFVARGAGGHSSAPGKNTPIPRLAKFICRVERKSPFTARLSPAVRAMFAAMAPCCPFGLRYLLGNLWLFGGLIKRLLPSISAQAGAMLRTTVCFTMQSGSEGYNLIPQEAGVCANLRFIPHQGPEESIAVIEKLAARYGLETQRLCTYPMPLPLALDCEAVKTTRSAIERCFPGARVVPYVVVGGTDARFFGEVCDGCVRFSPLIYGAEQMAGMHGLNENITTACLPGAVDYYKTIIQMQEL